MNSFKVFILVLGLSAVLNAQPEEYVLGPEYPQPGEAPPPPPEVEKVLPRLGAQSTYHSGYVIITGGLAYLPSNWPSDFNRIDSLHQNHAVAEVSAYVPFGDFVFNNDVPHADMHFPRAFHIAQNVDYMYSQIFVWGGGSDIIEKYDLISNAWEDVLPVGGDEPPVGRFGAASVSAYTDIFIFGGVQANGIAPTTLNIYDVATNQWRSHEPEITPQARYGASLNFVEGFLILFGGSDVETSTPLNDLWVFDLSSKEWTRANGTEEFDEARSFHGAVLHNEKLVIFLGESESYRDIIEFDFITGNWSTIHRNRNAAVPAIPTGFSYTSLQIVGDNSVLVFAGVRDTKSPVDMYSLQSEIWVLNLDTYKWSRVACYPSFVFDNYPNVCVAPSTDNCELCETCADYSEQRRTYIGKLKNKALLRDYSGILRQCPAVWKQTPLVI